MSALSAIGRSPQSRRHVPNVAVISSESPVRSTNRPLTPPHKTGCRYRASHGQPGCFHRGSSYLARTSTVERYAAIRPRLPVEGPGGFKNGFIVNVSAEPGVCSRGSLLDFGFIDLSWCSRGGHVHAPERRCRREWQARCRDTNRSPSPAGLHPRIVPAGRPSRYRTRSPSDTRSLMRCDSVAASHTRAPWPTTTAVWLST